MQKKAKFLPILLVIVFSCFVAAHSVSAEMAMATASVKNVTSQTITNTQVKVVFDATNFNFSLPRTDGSDIRFTDGTGTVSLPFWKQTYNAANKDAIFWVKIPSVAARATYTMNVYYGATVGSSYDATMQKLDATDDVVAQWHLDGGSGNAILDTKGNYSLVLQNNPAWTTNDGGNFQTTTQSFSTGHALSFNGVNQYATINNLTSYASQQGSLEFWFKFNQAPVVVVGSRQYLFSNQSMASWATAQKFGVYLDSSADTVNLSVSNNPNSQYILTGPVIQDANYHHLVVSWDGTYGVKFYVDGKLVGKGRFVGSMVDNPSVATLAGSQTVSGVGSFANITVDELQVVNHALSPQEIQAHFSRTKAVPFEKVMASPGNPVIYPTQTWEQTATYEPSVINDNGTLKMIYTSGWDNAGIGMAQSTDGITWTKISSGPVVGQGIAGQTYASRGDFVKVGNEYRIYFADKNPDANIKLATSTDGVHFTVQSQNVIGKNDVPGTYGWANTGTYFDGTNWWMLAEAYIGHDEWWQIHLFKSTDGGYTFQHVAGPITSLQDSPGGMYGGPRAFKKIGDTYHLWYHAGYITSTLPTAVWHATSTDMINWTPDPQPTVSIAESSLGLYSPDQTADTSMIEFNGKTFLFYDADDNSYGMSRIGVATFNGTLEQYVIQPFSVTLSSVVIPVDTIKPTITITSPRNFSHVSGLVTLSAVASDNIGIFSIEFTIDGQTFGGVGTVSPYSVPWNTNLIQNGTHIISVTAKDVAGNARTATITVKVMNTMACTGNRKLCPLPTLPGIINQVLSQLKGGPTGGSIILQKQGNASPASAATHSAIGSAITTVANSVIQDQKAPTTFSHPLTVGTDIQKQGDVTPIVVAPVDQSI